MKQWKAIAMGMATIAGLTPGLWAQPAVPAAPAGAAGAAGAAGSAGDAAGSGFGFIQKCQDQKEKCKNKLCKTPLGQMLNAMTKLPSLASGGIIPLCCPEEPNKFGLQEAKDKGGAEGAAAAIKKEEAEAKARRAAVRYLGTVDCHYYPEASKALIASLRADRNECVRWEAAMALGNGCCCNKNTIEALLIVVTCSEKDGNPTETSARVRNAAFGSLQHCLNCYCESAPAEKKETPPERPKEQPKEQPKEKVSSLSKLDSGELVLSAYYTEKLTDKPMGQVVDEAKKAVAEMKGGMARTSSTLPSGSQGLFDLIGTSFSASHHDAVETATVVQESKPVVVATPEPKPAVAVRESKPAVAIRETKPVPTPAPAAASTPRTLKEALFGAPDIREIKTPEVKYETPAAGPAPVKLERPVSAVPAPKSTPATSRTSAKIDPVPVVAPPIVQTVAKTETVAPPPVSKPVVATNSPAVKPAVRPLPVAPVATTVATRTLPAANVPTVSAYSSEGVPMLLNLLRTSVNPFQREWAVESLATTDCRGNPDVVPTLVKSAREDAAATVRTACVRRLTAMNVNTPQVVATFQALKSDPDPRVQNAAAQGLVKLGAGQPVLGAPSTAPANLSYRAN